MQERREEIVAKKYLREDNLSHVHNGIIYIVKLWREWGEIRENEVANKAINLNIQKLCALLHPAVPFHLSGTHNTCFISMTSIHLHFMYDE